VMITCRKGHSKNEQQRHDDIVSPCRNQAHNEENFVALNRDCSSCCLCNLYPVIAFFVPTLFL
ncbi:hypothetical protein CDAR_307101, partial [Caerostris darwini]